MSAPSLIAMPSSFAAGTTVKYTRALDGYAPSGGWALKLYLAGVGITDAIAGVPNSDGSTWNVTLSAAITAKLGPGTYQWREQVTLGGETYVAGSGVVVVDPNIATATAGQFQSFAERMLAAIESVIAGRIPADVESYQIAGRSLTRIPAKELHELRAQYRSEVSALKRPGKFGQTVFATFPDTV